jgi:hypothetical protein
MSNSIAALDTANPGQNSKKIFHRPLLGLASQHLLLPLWAMTGNGATFEWLLQATGADAVVGTATHAAVSGSTDWSITSVRCHLDILHVDEALMQSYTSHLLKGSSLVVPYRSYTPISFTHAGSNTAMLQVPRTFSRVNQIWVLPSKPAADLSKKDCNYYPSFGGVDTLESWIQIGSTKYPSTTYGPGTAEHLLRYQKALGYLGSGFHASSNTVISYNDDSMIIIFDLEKIPQQAMSGMSTHGGNVTININGLGTTTGGAVTTASRIDVLIWHDTWAEISDGSVQISY